MLKAHRRFPRVKEKLPRQPDKQHGRATTKGYSYYSIARNEKKGAYTMSTNEMTAKIKELKSLQALIEEAEAEADALKDQIKEAMGDSEELRVGEYKVTYKTVKSSRFDSASFKKAMPELYGQFTKTTQSRRFTIA